jgi:hypothetical protein
MLREGKAPDPLHGATLVVDLAGMPAASALLRRRRRA